MWPFGRSKAAPKQVEEAEPEQTEEQAEEPKDGNGKEAMEAQVENEHEDDGTEQFDGDLPSAVKNDPKAMKRIRRSDQRAKLVYNQIDNVIATLRNVRERLENKKS